MEPVYTNGFPKSGNHALAKAVQLLGLPTEAIGHQPYVPRSGAWAGVRREPSVFIKRDPRNVLISWIRHLGKPVTRGMAMAHMRRWSDAEPYSLVQALGAYEGWLIERDTFVVSYEDLVRDDAALRRLAAHLGVPYLEEAWMFLPGMTRTWNAQHSDYRAVWTPQVENEWDRLGGVELLERWGYAHATA